MNCHPSTAPVWATASTKHASGPFASTEPRPCRRPSSVRTGISPGTVSIWPRNTTCFGPAPITPTALPASSINESLYPSDFIRFTSQSTAGRSWPDGLYCDTRPASVSCDSLIGLFAHQHVRQYFHEMIDLLVCDHQRRQQPDHGHAGV